MTNGREFKTPLSCIEKHFARRFKLQINNSCSEVEQDYPCISNTSRLNFKKFREDDSVFHFFLLLLFFQSSLSIYFLNNKFDIITLYVISHIRNKITFLTISIAFISHKNGKMADFEITSFAYIRCKSSKLSSTRNRIIVFSVGGDLLFRSIKRKGYSIDRRDIFDLRKRSNILFSG